MTQIRTTLFALTTALLLSISFAQSSAPTGENFRDLLANDLDAIVVECPWEGSYCARLDFDASFAVELVSSQLRSYVDISPVNPWELEDGAYSRGYVLRESVYSHVYLVMVTDVLDLDRQSTIIIDRVGVWRGEEQVQ